MHPDHLATLHAWFEGYSRSFLRGDARKDGPLVLKIDHTHRVRSNMRLLAQSIGYADSHLCLAEAVGLLHDVGRFEQYHRYGTFNDSRSVNHAALGIEVIEQAGILDDLANDEHGLIVEAVRFHNAATLPDDRPPLSLAFMRLIRDADKLDIWKVFGDYYRSGLSLEVAIIPHLTNQPVWEAAILEDILQKRMAKFSAMRSINDFKLLQLSWVFDLNFPETFLQAQKRGDLAAIAGSLPDAPAVNRAVAVVMTQLDEMGGQA